MERWRHFGRNVGLWGIVRTVGVSALLAIVAVGVWLGGGDPSPAIAFVGGAAIATVARKLLVDKFEQSQKALRLLGIGIVVSAVLLGAVRERLGLSDGEHRLVLGAVLFFAAAYLGGYFWMLSDSQIFTERHRFAYLMHRASAEPSSASHLASETDTESQR